MPNMEMLVEFMELLQQLPEEGKQKVYRYMEFLKKQHLGGIEK